MLPLFSVISVELPLLSSSSWRSIQTLMLAPFKLPASHSLLLCAGDDTLCVLGVLVCPSWGRARATAPFTHNSDLQPVPVAVFAAWYWTLVCLSLHMAPSACFHVKHSSSCVIRADLLASARVPA